MAQPKTNVSFAASAAAGGEEEMKFMPSTNASSIIESIRQQAQASVGIDDEDDDNQWDEDDGNEKDYDNSDAEDLAEEEGDIYDSNPLQRLSRKVREDYLMTYHNELKQLNYTEITALAKVERDEYGNVIDPLHTTLPFLTKYERARILGVRAKQINSGAEPFISVDEHIIDGYVIAEMELQEKKIPFIISRPLPDGRIEYWRVFDLELLEY